MRLTENPPYPLEGGVYAEVPEQTKQWFNTVFFFHVISTCPIPLGNYRKVLGEKIITDLP